MVKRRPKKNKVLKRGLTIAYIGNGKGKTTAAVGLAVRARGYGMRVAFLQFYKSPVWPSGERVALRKIGIHVGVFGEGFVGILGDNKKRAVHRRAAQRALHAAWSVVISGRYDLVICDESISCLEQKLYPISAFLHFLRRKNKHPKAAKVHLVITGHKGYPAVLKLCDLVTEMKMVRHPYYQGFLAVGGIDY